MAATLFFVAIAAPALAGHAQWVGDEDTWPGPDDQPDDFDVSESEDSITLRFTAHLDPTHRANWQTDPDTAGDGSDFAGTSGTWPAPAGQSEQVPAVTVRLLRDNLHEETEQFGVMLWLDGYPDANAQAPTDRLSCLSHGWCDYATIYIEDDDPVGAQRVDGASPRVSATDRSATAANNAHAADASGNAQSASDSGTGFQPPPGTSGLAWSSPAMDALEPGPGFEIMGKRVRASQAAQRDGHGDGNDGVEPLLLALAVTVSALALGMWARRSRRTW